MANKTAKSTDCLPCRLISGFGIMGVGVYLYTLAQKRRPFEMYTMRAVSAVAFAVGIARLMNADILKSGTNDTK